MSDFKAGPAHLSLDVRHRLGALALDANFEVTQPWTVLFGPSGIGKSTILRIIAGLLRPHDAKITLRWGGQTQTATDTKANIFVPPQKRFVRWAAQRPALFPHMTVRDNLVFAASPNSSLIGDAMERFRIAHLTDRKPATLSGGEQQRVSIARVAVASEGRLLLLDEPFSGLDTSLRDELLADLRAWLTLTQTPVLSVTHDISEAFQLDAEVIKLREGRIVDQGPVHIVLVEERRRLLAQLGHQP